MTKRIDWRHELSRWTQSEETAPFIHAFVHLRCVYGAPIGEGRSRIVFRSRDKKSVIKLPRNEMGALANLRELKPDGWLGAPERSAKTWKDKQLTKQTGLLVIRMEHVEEARGELPSWVKAVDCEQVGYTKAGLLVAYDWGG